MHQTKAQETDLLNRYEPYLRRLVLEFHHMGGSQGVDNTEDLLQEARIAFVQHLRRISNESEIPVCRIRILNALHGYCRAMAPVKIPRYCFSKELRKIGRAEPDEIDSTCFVEPECVTFPAELSDFADTLTEDERVTLLMKMDGHTSREIIPFVRAKGEPQMSRLLSSVRKKVYSYFCEGDLS